MLGLLLMKTTIIITSVLFLAVIIASVFYFRDLNGDRQSRRKPFTHIPEDAALLVSFRNDETSDRIFAGYKLFEAILGDTQFRDLKLLRSNILKQGPVISATGGQEIVLSFHPEKSRIDYLMAVPMDADHPTATLFDEISATDTSFHLTWAGTGQERFRIASRNLSRPLFVGQRDGVILASFADTLVARAMDKGQPKLSMQAIEQFRSEDNKNTPMTLYLNHHRLYSLVGTLMQRAPGDFIQLLAETAGQSMLKMNFNSNALMFSGTSTLDTTTSYLALYSRQQSVEQQLKNVVPADAATYLLFGVSDFPALHRGIADLLDSRGEMAQMSEQHRLIQERSKVSIADDLLPLWGNEFAVIELANRETLGIIEVKDSLGFARVIQQISTDYPENMYRLNHSNLLYYSFGDPLRSFTRPYFLLTGNYFVFANNTSTLRRFAADNADGRTLASTPGYLNFDRLQANKANVSVFVHNENAANAIAQRLKPAFRAAYTAADDFGYPGFYAWSFQLSGASGRFFSNFYARYIDDEAPGVTPEWTFDLGGRLIAPPMVFQYDDTSRFILAQASSDILYALSTSGKQLWNAQLPGTVLGDILQLADSSILLTTAERLYRFDVHGDPLPGFSLELPHRASYGAIAYENDGDLRLFVPAGNRILAYDAKGKTLSGWTNQTLKGDIQYGLKQATLQDIHYVVAATDAGNVYFFNYNGQLIHRNEGDGHTVFRNPIALQSSPEAVASSYVITSDTAGILKRFYFENRQSVDTTGNRSANHYFDAINIAGDTVPELVFTDRGELSIYDNTGDNLVYQYDFGQDIENRPIFFPAAAGKYRVGVATSANQLLYVFNEDGTLVQGFPITGLSPFYFGTLQDAGRSYLLVDKGDRKLYAYPY